MAEKWSSLFLSICRRTKKKKKIATTRQQSNFGSREMPDRHSAACFARNFKRHARTAAPGKFVLPAAWNTAVKNGRIVKFQPITVCCIIGCLLRRSTTRERDRERKRGETSNRTHSSSCLVQSLASKQSLFLGPLCLRTSVPVAQSWLARFLRQIVKPDDATPDAVAVFPGGIPPSHPRDNVLKACKPTATHCFVRFSLLAK